MERFASVGKINLQKIFTGRRGVVVPAAEEWECIRPSPGTQPRMGVKLQLCAVIGGSRPDTPYPSVRTRRIKPLLYRP
jgi:hypothetical protein